MTITLTQLGVDYAGAGTPALSNVTLTFEPGEQVALIGPSGAGKTTLLQTLALAQRPHNGVLEAFGCMPWEQSSARRHALRAQLFLAPQTPPLPPRQRVVSAVLAGRLPHWSLWRAIVSLLRPLEVQRAFDALSRFSLEHKLYNRVERLSGGERQRCSIARLLVCEARVLLVDEPLSALDPTLALQTLAVIQEEATRRNAILVCSLHQVELARERFSRLVGLREGRVVFDARKEDVSDAMVEALYRNASGQTEQLLPAFDSVNHSGPEIVVVPRC